MIARTWTGVVRRADADAYADYIRETGFAERYLIDGRSSITHHEVVDESGPP